MGLKTIKGEERFVFETEEERSILDKARNYFQSSKLLLHECGYKTSTRSSAGIFGKIRNGKESDGRIRAISVESFKKIQDYASRFDEGERYDSNIFIITETVSQTK